MSKGLGPMGRRTSLLEDSTYESAWAFALRKVRGVDARGLPRYGLLSLIAQRTPFFLYDHPALQRLSATAFTDGSACFVNLPFFVQMMREEQDHPRTQYVLFALLHELQHKAYEHVARSPQIAKTAQESDLLNIAQDIFLNMRLWKGYPDIRWAPSVIGGDHARPAYYGLTQEEVDRYWTWTEVQIYADIHNRVAAVQQAYQEGYGDGRQEVASGPGQGQNSGQSPGTSPQVSEQEQGEEASAGAPKEQGQDKSQGKTKGKGGSGRGAKGDPLKQAYEQGHADGTAGKVPLAGTGARHTVTPEDLRDVLDQEGLSEAADKLKLPRRGDGQGMEARAKWERQQLEQDLERARTIRSQGGDMAGAHVEEAFQTAITELYEPKLSIRTALRHLIQGEGSHMGYSEGLPDPIYYLPAEALGATHPIYDGTYLPAENQSVVIVIVDTSGSMSDEALHEVFSEAFGIVSEEPLEAPQVRLYSADTVIRGEPLHLTPENWEDHVEGLRAYGRGGTELQEPLEAALAAVREEGRPLAGIVYFTDTYAEAPDFEALGEPLPSIVFIAPRDDPGVTRFREAVQDYAEVLAIDAVAPGHEIELGPRP